MSHSELIIIKKSYDFSKWLLHHTGKFPKNYRFSIATRIDNHILEFIELLTQANMRSYKLPILRTADEVLAKLRLMFRLSYEMRFINSQSYEYGCICLVELGKMNRNNNRGFRVSFSQSCSLKPTQTRCYVFTEA